MARITAVQDRATVTLEMLAGALHMPVGHVDTNIGNAAIATAKEQADGYLNNTFLDEDGVELSIPSSVVTGCVAYAAAVYARTIPGIKSEKTDYTTIEFDPEQVLIHVKGMFWKTYKRYRVCGAFSRRDEETE